MRILTVYLPEGSRLSSIFGSIKMHMLTVYLPCKPRQYVVGKHDVLAIDAAGITGTITYSDGHSESWSGFPMRWRHDRGEHN